MTDEPAGELILYRADDGQAQVQLRSVSGTVWLTQAELAELYGTSVPNITQIIKRVLADGEVNEATINSELIVRTEGTREVQREILLYDLEMILAIGYRVSTPRAVQFRQWATTVLKEYLVKGFALQDERLKDPAASDYFDELLERIRAIRGSEKRFYQKVRDIVQATSADYDAKSSAARDFFATIQNKLVYAVTGRTAGELVRERCDPGSETLGLTSWTGGQPRRSGAEISKNYLTAAELSDLNLLVNQFLDFAEGRARRRQATLMNDWVAQTDRFIEFNELEVLKDRGTVSRSQVEHLVRDRFPEWDTSRREREAAQAALDESVDLDALIEKGLPRDPEG